MSRLLTTSRLIGFAPPVLCCAALFICVLISAPFANAGFNDDWSYSYVAQKLAETGHLHYSGWGSPTILFQSLWGAAWIRMFGFSFNLLRAVSIPFSIGFVLLTFGLARDVGLNKSLAAFAALTVACSPLFVPIAASFMTEPYACFFSLLCVYAGVNSAAATDSQHALSWLWLVAISGVLGGADRQSVWAAPMLLIPYLLWSRRSDRRYSVHAILSWCICAAFMIFVLWQFSQPYGPLHLSQPQVMEILVDHWAPALISLASLALSGILMMWPIFFCVGSLRKNLGLNRFVTLFAISAMITVMLVWLRVGLVPFVGNILSPTGILEGGREALGYRPDILPLVSRLILTWLLTSSVAVGVYLHHKCPGILGQIPRHIFMIFFFGYVPLLIPGALIGLTFDRYLLPLLPIGVVTLLVLLQYHIHRIPITGWAGLFIFASYSVLTTHDYFSALRARGTVAEILKSNGVSVQHISAGLEYDGWTQLQLAGVLKAVQFGDPYEGNTTDTFWFWNYTPAIKPDFVVVNAQRSVVLANERLRIPFRTWVPPFERAAVALKRLDLKNSKQQSQN